MSAASDDCDEWEPPPGLDGFCARFRADIATKALWRAPATLPDGVFGRFVEMKLLGGGASGVVYAARDPKLKRHVAIKLTRPSGADEPFIHRAQQLEEAQALARLSHQNVVGVLETGEYGSSIWMAMEYVSGWTLDAWARARRPAWREIRDVLIQSGRGLAAIHAAGLIHGDIKPENVMLGDDARVRVMDLGFARDHIQAADEVASTVTAATALSGTSLDGPEQPRTGQGIVPGTKGYTAPEQLCGPCLSARSDQFAWCVMAWELLFGARPFEHQLAIFAGVRREPPQNRGVPGWLRRVLDRGLSRRPNDRWPTMAALVDALQHGELRARRKLAVITLVGAATFGAAAQVYLHHEEANRVAACLAEGGAIARVWNASMHDSVREAFAATDAPYATSAAEKVMPWLDRQAEAWTTARSSACLNHHVYRRWSDDRLNRTLWCLGDRETALKTLVAEFSRANDSTVRKAVTAAASLSTAEDCMLDGWLMHQPVPSPSNLEISRSVHAQLSAATSLSHVGNYAAGLHNATKAREAAEAVGWVPLHAAALANEANLFDKLGRYDDAVTANTEAYFMGAQADAWDVAAEAATNLVRLIGVKRAAPDAGRAWARHARLAIGHVGEPDGLAQARVLGNLGIVAQDAGDFKQAASLFEQAMAITRRVYGPDHPALAGLLVTLAGTYTNLDRRAEARQLLERGTLIQERALGTEHPDYAAMLSNYANVLHKSGQYAAARARHTRALTIRERVYGRNHPDVAASLTSLADAAQELGEHEEALELLEEALAIRMRVLGPEHPDVGVNLSNLGIVYLGSGQLVKARAMHQQALAIKEARLPADHPEIADSLNNLTGVYLRAGEYAETIPLFKRALKINEKAYGVNSIQVAAILGNYSSVLRILGEHRAALEMNERVLRIFETILGPEHPHVASAVQNLGSVYHQNREYERALPLYLRALAIRERSLPPNHPHVGMSLHNLGTLYQAMRRYTDAEASHTRALSIFRKADGTDHFALAQATAGLGSLYLAMKRPDEALPMLERAVGSFSRAPGVQEGEAEARFDLAKALVLRRGDRGRAILEAQRARDAFREVEGSSHEGSTEVTRWLARHAG